MCVWARAPRGAFPTGRAHRGLRARSVPGPRAAPPGRVRAMLPVPGRGSGRKRHCSPLFAPLHPVPGRVAGRQRVLQGAGSCSPGHHGGHAAGRYGSSRPRGAPACCSPMPGQRMHGETRASNAVGARAIVQAFFQACQLGTSKGHGRVFCRGTSGSRKEKIAAGAA